MPRLKKDFVEKYKSELMEELKLENAMQVPNILKISVNAGVGEATKNSNAIDEVVEIISSITGQKPNVNKARISVAQFKLREGQEVGVNVTLRGDNMWAFLDKFISVTLPRTKDFRGLKSTAFDGNGNYSVGIIDHTVFPEIDTSRVSKLRSLQINITTSTKVDAHAKALLDKFGFPFKK